MKVTKTTPEYSKITLELTTKEEAAVLWHLLNISTNGMKDINNNIEDYNIKIGIAVADDMFFTLNAIFNLDEEDDK